MALELPASAKTLGQTWEIFCRCSGAVDAPWLTLLHGFPTCSWDYARIAPGLENSSRVLAFDFLGFGDSDKPRSFPYSLFLQADVTEAVWQCSGVRRSCIVAHDYGATVAQELLARQAEGRLATEIAAVTFLNGALYADLHRPLAIQRLLHRPVVGPLLAALASERMFRRNFCKVFSANDPLTREEVAQHWSAITRRGGHRLAHRLIHYIGDRERHHERWEGALESARVPMNFVWGMEDPVSGAHVAERIRARLPEADRVELAGVGHYPQIEAPERVVPEVERMAYRKAAPAGG